MMTKNKFGLAEAAIQDPIVKVETVREKKAIPKLLLKRNSTPKYIGAKGATHITMR